MKTKVFTLAALLCCESAMYAQEKMCIRDSMYGLAFEFLYEFCVGCHIYFLTRTPSPKIIFQALSLIHI